MFYMYYCRLFIKSLEPHYVTIALSDKTRISDEVGIQFNLQRPVKHLINIMSINNIFCHNLFLRANLWILQVIDSCSLACIDLVSSFAVEGYNRASNARSYSSNVALNAKIYIDLFTEWIQSFTKKDNEPITRKQDQQILFL